MKRRELINIISARIEGIYSLQEARTIAYAVAERFFGFGRTHAVVEPMADVAEFDERMLDDVCRRLLQHQPLQYVVGTAEFCGLPFRVADGVLIPRPETEELVEWIVADMRGKQNPTILDIGTGSGAIAVALASMITDAVVDAVDVSEKALDIASQNAENNGVSVFFMKNDALANVEDFTKRLPHSLYDAVVSNPPYIPASEYDSMADNVRKYEPSLALFVEDADPLLFYREIGLKALSLLCSGGCLYFEIHERFADEVCSLLTAQGYADVVCRCDINDKPRMVAALKR